MANLSTANGTVRVTADSSELAKSIIETIYEVTSKWYYYTIFYTKEGSESKEGKWFECNFDGQGRWTFTSNLESFADWLRNDPEMTDELRKRLESFRKYEFKLDFEYSDEESGNGVLEEGKISLIHKKDYSIYRFEYEEKYIHSYEWNKVNLMDICGYDEEQASLLTEERAENAV